MKRNARVIAGWDKWTPPVALPSGVECRKGRKGRHEFVALYAAESDRRVVLEASSATPEALKSLAKKITV